MGRKLMIFVDFDGTISKEDVCCSMVDRFAAEGWQDINRLWEEGALSTEECAQQTLDIMTVSPDELESFFTSMEIDESFPDFVRWSRQNDYPLYIVSDGYDNYIDLLCKKYQLELPIYANHLEYRQGWQIECPYLDQECQQCGVCKTGIIRQLARPGFITVYIGDGYSDMCPADNTDIVFAKKTLARLCSEKNIKHHPYSNFHDIKQILEKEWSLEYEL